MEEIKKNLIKRMRDLQETLRYFFNNRINLLVTILLLLSIPISIMAIKQKQFKSKVKANGSFVQTSGSKLMINNQPYKFIGVNRYNLATLGGYPYSGCAGVFPDSDLTKFFSELKSMGANSVRFWLFQDFTRNGTDFSRMDLILNLASDNNVKVVPVFENQWDACTQGGYKYNTWYQTGYLSPYGNYPHSLKEYIKIVVSRYKDNPNILMWQIMNEAESKDLNGNPDFQSLYNFASDVSSYIKLIDPNHLVSLGTMGGGQPGTAGDYYKQLHSIQTIDILENHDYGQETNAMTNEVNTDLNIAEQLNKPIFIGEAGIAGHCTGVADGFTCFTDEQRAQLFSSKMTSFFSRNASAGYLIWSYRDWTGSTNQPLDFIYTDPLVSVIRNISGTLPKPTIFPTILPTPTSIPTAWPTTQVSTIPTTTPRPSISPTPTNTPDTVSPTVNITSPANNSTFKRNTSIKILTNATDNIGIKTVSFYANNINFCNDTTAPYECSWRPSRVGNYVIKSTATDTSSNSSSATISVTITQK